MKTAQKLRIALLAALALAIGLALYLGGDFLKQSLLAFVAWVKEIGPWGPVLLGLVYVLACILLVPGTILSLGAGFAFGPLVGTITISIASTLGASAAFLVGRKLARQWVQRKIAGNPRFGALDQAVERQGFKIVLLVRLSPLFPFNLVNYAFGLTKVPFWHYFLASWIGMLPGTIMYVYLGSTIRSVADLAAGNVEEGSTAQTVLFWVGLAATVVVTVFITRLANRALKEALPAKAEATPPEESPHG